MHKHYVMSMVWIAKFVPVQKAAVYASSPDLSFHPVTHVGQAHV